MGSQAEIAHPWPARGPLLRSLSGQEEAASLHLHVVIHSYQKPMPVEHRPQQIPGSAFRPDISRWFLRLRKAIWFSFEEYKGGNELEK